MENEKIKKRKKQRKEIGNKYVRVKTGKEKRGTKRKKEIKREKIGENKGGSVR